MKIRLLRKVRRGTVLDVSDAQAEDLIRDGLAERLADPPVAPAPEPAVPEAAALAPAPERAVTTRPRARG